MTIPHVNPPLPSTEERQHEDGRAILRVVKEIREIVAGEAIDPSFLADLDRMEKIGKWLSVAQVITSGRSTI